MMWFEWVLAFLIASLWPLFLIIIVPVVTVPDMNWSCKKEKGE